MCGVPHVKVRRKVSVRLQVRCEHSWGISKLMVCLVLHQHELLTTGGELRAFRADLVECDKESVHTQLIVSVLDIILLHEADHLTTLGMETQWSFEEEAQYEQTILDAINLIESTSKKDLLTTKTAWDMNSNFPPI